MMIATSPTADEDNFHAGLCEMNIVLSLITSQHLIENKMMLQWQLIWAVKYLLDI